MYASFQRQAHVATLEKSSQDNLREDLKIYATKKPKNLNREIIKPSQAATKTFKFFFLVLFLLLAATLKGKNEERRNKIKSIRSTDW
jgi:hypothetical protein